MQQRQNLTSRPSSTGTLPQVDVFVGHSFDTKCFGTHSYQNQTSVGHCMRVVKKDLKTRWIVQR